MRPLFADGIPGATAAAAAQASDEIVAYLLHRQDFRQCLCACRDILPSNRDTRTLVRTSVSAMIDSPYYTTVVRPSLMRMAAGDPSLAHRHDVARPSRRVLALAREAAEASRYDVRALGPEHASALELACLARVNSHASKFAQRRARFLAIYDKTRHRQDTMHDLVVMAQRSYRWYYPFRAGLYMDNTVRSSLTNRGLSYIKYHTRQCRGRMVTSEDGVTQHVETYCEVTLENATDGRPVERDTIIRLVAADVLPLGTLESDIVRLSLSYHEQEQFMEWLAEQGDTGDAASPEEAAAALGTSIRLLRAEFLLSTPDEYDRACRRIQRRVHARSELLRQAIIAA